MTATFTVTNRKALDDAVDPHSQRVAGEIASAARAATPRRSGALAAGWRTERSATGRWNVVNNVEYGRYVEYGTRHVRAAAMLGRAAAAARGRYVR